MSPAVTLDFESGEETTFDEAMDQRTGDGLVEQKPPGKLSLVDPVFLVGCCD